MAVPGGARSLAAEFQFGTSTTFSSSSAGVDAMAVCAGGSSPEAGRRSSDASGALNLGLLPAVSSEGGNGSGAPLLVDASCRVGPCAGGTIVWLHGCRFTEGVSVRFGGAAASACQVVSDQLLKCASPAFFPGISQERHEVAITVLTSTGAPVAGSIPFAYTSKPTADGEAATTQTPKELLRRLLASLERAQAAAAAAAAASSAEQALTGGILPGSPAMGVGTSHAELGLSAFNVMDEHGYSLAEYTTELKETLGFNAFSAAANGPADASDLQLQHQEMAAMMKRERLSTSLAKRPSIDLLHQRNILPDSEGRRAGAEKLATSFANRPSTEFLQERNILQPPGKEDGEEQLLAKRKRLESFLVQRPTFEQVQATLGAEAIANPSLVTDPALQAAIGEEGLSTLDAALGAFVDDVSFRSADDNSLRVDDL